MEADSILRLANCDPKSVNYFASQLPLLDGPEWDMDKQYKVASNVKPYQAADHIGKVLGDTASCCPIPRSWRSSIWRAICLPTSPSRTAAPSARN